MDILYIVGRGCSKCENNELRYSLRSIEMYGKNVGEVYVCGYCPEFLSSEVIQIPCEDVYDNKRSHSTRTANVLWKLLYAVDHSDIGEKFLVSFDDNFYIRDTDFSCYPHYVKLSSTRETLLPVYNEDSSDYAKMLANTRKICEEQGLPVYNFAVHRNLNITRRSIEANREFLEKVVREAIPCDRFVFLQNWELKNYPFHRTPVRDVKLAGGMDWWMTDPEKTECFSTVDFHEGLGLDNLLHERYPNISKYEKWDIKEQLEAKIEVSVIVPVFNTAPYLRRCLDSILAQTIRDIEIFCINDGSTDESFSILREYEKKDLRIHVFNTKNQGCGPARNVGLDHARGEYVCFVDSDDWIDPEYLESMLEYRGYDMIRQVRVFGEKNIHGTKRKYGPLVPALHRRNFLLDNELRFRDVRPGEDSDLLKRIWKCSPSIFNCPDTGVYYHYMLREGSLSKYKKEQVENVNYDNETNTASKLKPISC